MPSLVDLIDQFHQDNCIWHLSGTLAQLGTRIQQLTDPFSQAVRMSISCGEKNHPFPDSLLHQIREAMGAIPTDGASPGQPFFLTLISRLAKEAGDPDWEYPLTLQEGVPLGVEETTLTSPGVWPTKEELYVVSQTNMKIWLPQWGDTTMIRRKNFPMPSNRPLRRKGSWTWLKGHLPSRKQPIAAVAPLPNFDGGH